MCGLGQGWAGRKRGPEHLCTKYGVLVWEDGKQCRMDAYGGTTMQKCLLPLKGTLKTAKTVNLYCVCVCFILP